jgi:hypothetical protein
VQQFLAANRMAVFPHPPDLAPCDFFLFLRMKLQVQEPGFQDVPRIQEQVLSVLRMIQKSHFQQWHNCSTHCINSEGDYFEGNNSNQ